MNTEISKALLTKNPTEIFKIAKKLGIDVSSKTNVFNFIKQHAPNENIRSEAYMLSYGSNHFKGLRCTKKNGFENYFREPIVSAIRYAKQQKKDGWSNYSKVMILGNENIYWAHPVYQHSDYNKSIAFPNTEKNREIATVINKYLGYEFNA